MTDEVVGIWIFSGFMLFVVGVLVGNVCVALYRERKARREDRGDPDSA
jgi:hypothetical protein